MGDFEKNKSKRSATQLLSEVENRNCQKSMNWWVEKYGLTGAGECMFSLGRHEPGQRGTVWLRGGDVHPSHIKSSAFLGGQK